MAVVVVVIIVTVLLGRRPRMRYGEILPAGEMQEKYNLTAERYKPPDLDPGKVPDNLRDLLGLSIKWWIGDDIIRYDFEQKASEEEKSREEGLAGQAKTFKGIRIALFFIGSLVMIIGKGVKIIDVKSNKIKNYIAI